MQREELPKAEARSLSRRDFVKWSGKLAAGSALAGMAKRTNPGPRGTAERKARGRKSGKCSYMVYQNSLDHHAPYMRLPLCLKETGPPRRPRTLRLPPAHMR
jgi:hypothetical protein